MLRDSFGRIHNYIRISLTERCNLRCTYCMPADGVVLSPKEGIMTADEIEKLASIFVHLGINKIRLTGGEPLVREDFEDVALRLGKLNVELAITTNGILIDRYLETFKKAGIKKINVSIDTLNQSKFENITRRNLFEKVKRNIDLLFEHGFTPKLNVVVMKNVNDDELMDFIKLTQSKATTIQFIEFMPFHGNKWDSSQTVKSQDILAMAENHFGKDQVIKLQDSKNDTSKKYRIIDFTGAFGFISTVSNPFCDTCNRIRLTANGRIKNCLFSATETDLLTVLRTGGDVKQLIIESVQNKKQKLGGIKDFTNEEGRVMAEENRSMIMIGG